MNVGSLFTGIGGFDLGLERAGMRVVWQCEQDDYCRRVLARHWPGVPCHPDVRALVADARCERGERRGGRGNVAGSARAAEGEGLQRQRGRDAAGDSRAGADGEAGPLPVPVPYVDVLCGGFPCQDLSLAGKGAGIDGARSGLWSEYARLVGELRPRYVIVENVAALLARGMGRVLGDLAALGYDAEWDCLPASAFGAPHQRDRVWLVAYPDRQSQPGIAINAEQGRGELVPRRTGDVADADGQRAHGSGEQQQRGRQSANGGGSLGGNLADARGIGCWQGPRIVGGLGTEECGWWLTEPDVGRVAHGIPARVDRLRSLGNALVPQIAEWIGRRIMSFEAAA